MIFKGSVLMSLIVLGLAVCLDAGAKSEPSCNIQLEKKEHIQSLLCGQYAPEIEYRFSGPGCTEKSARKRVEDSAIQIVLYRKCGAADFSERLKEANIRAFGFFDALQACTDSHFDSAALFAEAIQSMTIRAADVQCTADRRALLESRRGFFEQTITMSMDPNTIQSVFEKMGIAVDAQGNVTDN